MPEFEVSVCSSIEDVDAATWDALAGDHVFMSHGWLRTVERTSAYPTVHCYLLVHLAGTLVAATANRIERDINRRTDSAEVLLGGLARAVPVTRSLVFPALTCGSGAGHGSPLLIRPDLGPEERNMALRVLVEALLEEGRSAGAILRVRNVPKEDDTAIASLIAAGCIRTREWPNSVLDIEWDSYGAYLAHLRHLHPGAEKSARNEYNRGRRAGLRIECVPEVAPVEGLLHALADAHYRRRNNRPFPFRRGFFTRMRENLGEQAVIYLASIDGQAVGLVVMVVARQEAFLPFVGIDPALARPAAAYYNLVFNRPIRDAIERRIKRLYFGRLLYRMKIRRGCRLTNEDMFVGGGFAMRHAALRPLMSMRSWAMDLRLRRQIGFAGTATPR